MVLNPEVFSYLKDDTTVFEQEPMTRLAAEGQLMSFYHDGFWQCMDTQREMQLLETLWQSGNAPWKIWKIKKACEIWLSEQAQQQGENTMKYDLNTCREFYQGKRVLVTGHTGFKGSWLCRILTLAGAQVTGYAAEAPTDPALFSIAGLADTMDSVIGDIRDLEHLKEGI